MAGPGGLPSPRTRLIGRAQELASLKALLTRGDVRLVTLTGPGGVGKTRLALDAMVSAERRFPDGIRFVDLAPIGDPALVLPAIARAVAFESPSGTSLAAALVEHLRGRKLLLVLDSLEHLLVVAPMLSELLDCPGLKLLATSRAPLRLRGEHELTIEPLPVPALFPAGRMALVPSVALFVERARASQAAFSLTNENTPHVAEICRRLDGLPLALELAAARTRTLPPAALLARLDDVLNLLDSGPRDVPARHRTLRAALAWSYDLLSPGAQSLFRQLAVFAGGATLDTIEAVVHPLSLAPAGVLTALTELVDNSLAHCLEPPGGTGAARYRMLETVRAFSLDRLACSAESPHVWKRFADHFVHLVEAAQAELVGPHQTIWLDRLEREYENLRAALTWHAGHEVTSALRLAASLHRFWFARGHVPEGRAWMTRLLAMSATHTEADASEARARGLAAAAELAMRQGDYAAARQLVDECLPLARRIDDRRGAASALYLRGYLHWHRAAYAPARATFEESLALCLLDGDTALAARVLEGLGFVAQAEGALERAEASFRQSLSLRRDLGDRLGIAVALDSLGTLRQLRADLPAARAYLEEAVAVQREVGNRGVPYARSNLADVLTILDDRLRAARLFQETLADLRDLGDRRGIARTFEGLAGLALAGDRPLPAVRLLGAAQGLRDALGAPAPPDRRAHVDHLVDVARRSLPTADVDEALAAGRAAASTALDGLLDEALALAAALRVPAPAAGDAYHVLNTPRRWDTLTRRELEVAGLIGAGLSNKEIAVRLVTMEATAAKHVEHILRKLGFRSRTQVAAWAIERGLAHALDEISEAPIRQSPGSPAVLSA